MSSGGQKLLMGTVLTVIALAIQQAGAQTADKGGWIDNRDEEAGLLVRTMRMTLHPRGEPRPALKYRFLPDEFEMNSGNSATYYIKAMGFLEQNSARDRIREIYTEASERAQREDKSISELPPHMWQNMPPGDLPLDEVNEFLRLTSFQPPLLREAWRRNQFDMNRNLRETDDPIAYLLPEIQSMRQLVRLQTVRCKVAIAEGRIDDAIAILGQQLAVARHLGQDEFIVSNLVGIACGAIAWSDALYLVQNPDTPNLYWAFASLPKPLIDMRRGLAVERQFLYLQLKVLREVTEELRPAGYWSDFLDRLLPQIGSLAADLELPSPRSNPVAARAALVGYIAAAYPDAKRYLIEDCNLARAQVDAYPTAQVVFLAAVRFYDEARDDYFKWMQLPYWQIDARIRSRSLNDHLQARVDRVGWSATPSQLVLPAVFAVRTAMARAAQMLALVQTVEAIRMYGASHKGELPETLDDLPVPAPVDPFDGQSLDYRFQGETAVLTGHDMPGIRYKLILRFADDVE